MAFPLFHRRGTDHHLYARNDGRVSSTAGQHHSNAITVSINSRADELKPNEYAHRLLASALRSAVQGAVAGR
jgi:hypothetical protein